MKKDILSLLDLEKADFDRLFERAIALKARRKQGILDTSLAGKTVGLLFDKASTRTRISFEAATAQLGGTSLFIAAKDTQMARAEPIRDTARVMARYLDALVIRTFAQSRIAEFAEWAGIPVINALTDAFHPCQILSDLMTVVEAKGGYAGLKYAWVGDGNNVAQSWINAAAVLGLNLVLACPEGYHPDPEIMNRALANNCGTIKVTDDPTAAVVDADVIYTDVWASMGQEAELAARKKIFMPFQVNDALVAKASPEVIVMHCLPAHRDEEITDAVMEGPRSVVWDQSENKLHMHKAVLEALVAQ